MEDRESKPRNPNRMPTPKRLEVGAKLGLGYDGILTFIFPLRVQRSRKIIEYFNLNKFIKPLYKTLSFAAMNYKPRNAGVELVMAVFTSIFKLLKKIFKMKKVFFMFIVLPVFSIAQEPNKKSDSSFYQLDFSKKHETKKTQLKKVELKPIDTAIVENSNAMAKSEKNGIYFFEDIPVSIENGHGDSVVVLFSAYIQKKVWDDFALSYNMNEKFAFSRIARSLSLNARYVLKNDLSFEPLKKQKFINDASVFQCMY